MWSFRFCSSVCILFKFFGNNDRVIDIFRTDVVDVPSIDPIRQVLQVFPMDAAHDLIA